MSRAEKIYNKNIEENKKIINSLNKVIAEVGWIRLIILIIGAVIGYKLYKNGNTSFAITTCIITIVVFAAVAIIHGKIIEKRERIEGKLDFNEKGLKRIKGEYRSFEDKGEDLLEEEHPYAEDLDIFGQNSLFQMINTTKTIGGRLKLGELLLLKKLPTKEEIEEKQEAIKELANKVEWREELYVSGSFKKRKGGELADLIAWTKEKTKSNTIKIAIACIFIALTLGFIFLSIIKVIPITFLILDFMVNYAVIKILTRDMDKVIKLFHLIKNDVKAYAKILALIETEEFKSPYLNRLKNKLKSDSNKSCTEEMKKLSELLDWVGDSSGNAYFFILNVVAFADVFIMNNLDKWKSLNGDSLEGWLKVMAEFDALSSIANLGFDHEEWCYSEISSELEVKGEDIAHPLIGERAVANSYELAKPKQITLITGSNMSGKSTFLRTIGINLLLTFIGAPADAKSFKCSIMNIYTCMRTKDNLEESISSFYAEILRIKLIIEACNKGEKIFFLLDEIFKGTNSKDRHTGATVLVKQLAESGAIGLLSTHDLELCDLEESMKEIENYNFREYYVDNKINFDYKLRKGKSTTQNAVYLMRLAGIEIKNTSDKYMDL